MNIFPSPQNWKDLEEDVCLLFCQIGITAEVEKKIDLPNNKTIVIDVYAEDKNSVDSIKYIVECKNWNIPVRQSVIHSFITVMHEIGADVGFIVSKKGFQSGSHEFVQNTNIRLFTFDDLQKHYLNPWIRSFFIPLLLDVSERLNYYVEPCNSKRTRELEKADSVVKQKFYNLLEEYRVFVNGLVVALYICKEENISLDISKVIELFTSKGLVITSDNMLGVLDEMKGHIENITHQFDELFDYDIFSYN